MARYIYNPQLITSYDRIDKPSQVVLGQTSPERYVSAQPAGWEAVLTRIGDRERLVWSVRDMNKPDSTTFKVTSVKAIKQAIQKQHNQEITDYFAEAAIAWVDYYNRPENYVDKARTNPQLLESIYRCAARSRLHKKDRHDTSGNGVV